ncbi:MAG: hypothetical protein DHS20C17_05200 [Cyclobacteriaceae bacterium]|nr:MAG: hypothetical protein DHS20C17_05200 [Cyclobacteriaceae bacterium]
MYTKLVKKEVLKWCFPLILLSILSEAQEVNLEQYPKATIENDQVSMLVYLPDAKKGLYRGTRFDWSGMIGSVLYQGHEYFGYWKNTHDPMVHEDLTGPVEGYIKPGLGYEEAAPGSGFIRIGVGVIEREAESEYQWKKTYNVLDHGDWSVNQGSDWISFTHQVNGDFGYGYHYTKTIRLKGNGFVIEHKLRNTGDKPIETDQFNHNFFMIDGTVSGPAFTIKFPYDISTGDDLKDLMRIDSNELHFLKEFRDTNLFLTLTGYSEQVEDHEVTVLNTKSGAGVSLSMDQPIYRMCFWACETTLCPENFIWISVPPGETMDWNSDYRLFVE